MRYRRAWATRSDTTITLSFVCETREDAEQAHEQLSAQMKAGAVRIDLIVGARLAERTAI